MASETSPIGSVLRIPTTSRRRRGSHDAGELGEVGERKLEEGQDKKGIWGSRPPTPDEDTKAPAPAARKPSAS